MARLNTAVTLAAVTVLNHLQRLRTSLRREKHRGSGTVETIIIVAGFAGLALTVYLAVQGKVEGWITKIPGASGP